MKDFSGVGNPSMQAALERIEAVMEKLYSEDKRFERRDLAQELDAVLDVFSVGHLPGLRK